MLSDIPTRKRHKTLSLRRDRPSRQKKSSGRKIQLRDLGPRLFQRSRAFPEPPTISQHQPQLLKVTSMHTLQCYAVLCSAMQRYALS